MAVKPAPLHPRKPARPRPEPPAPRELCSFCGKAQDQVEVLIRGPLVYICDECTGECVGIIERATGPRVVRLSLKRYGAFAYHMLLQYRWKATEVHEPECSFGPCSAKCVRRAARYHRAAGRVHQILDMIKYGRRPARRR